MQTISDILFWGSTRLRSAQHEALQKNKSRLQNFKRWNECDLAAMIDRTTAQVVQNGEQARLVLNVNKRLRFADMKHHGGLKVYNRPVWGVMGGRGDSVINRIKAAQMEQLQQTFREQITQIGFRD